MALRLATLHDGSKVARGAVCGCFLEIRIATLNIGAETARTSVRMDTDDYSEMRRVR